MKKIYLILFCIAFAKISFCQSLFDVALKDKSILLAEKPIKIRLGNFEFKSREFYGYLGVLRTEFPEKDTTELKKLLKKAQSVNPNLAIWTENEIQNKIIVKPNQYIRPRIAAEKINWTTKEEKKVIIKQIRKYNRNNTMWPNFPVYMSRPVYSESGNYAIIGFINGKSTGETVLFKKINEEWILIADFIRWAY